MPTPPKKGESTRKFIGRAISKFVSEGKPQKQSIAIAFSQARRAGRKVKKR